MIRMIRFTVSAILSACFIAGGAPAALADNVSAPTAAKVSKPVWTRSNFDEYIRRFNAHDETAFDDYIAPEMRMLNGTLAFTGVQGMKDHYLKKIWPFYKEELHVERFVSDANSIAIQMWAHFTASKDADTLFGSVRAGETFDFHGVIMYEITNNKFSRITVAYNSFMHTDPTGKTVNMGIPH